MCKNFIQNIGLKEHITAVHEERDSIVMNGPGPLNITIGSDMPITLLHLMLMSKVYVVNSDMKNVICMSDPNVMFKGPGPICRKIKLVT